MNTKKLTFLSLSVALSMILSFIESQIPPFVAIPGIKLGLSNVVTVFLLYTYTWREAGVVSLVRVLLSSLLFGSPVSLIYSLAGAGISFTVMAFLKHIPIFNEISVSTVGGVFHNAAQITVACIVMENAAISSYLPALVLSGTVAGVSVGLISGILVKKLKGKLVSF